MVDPEPVSKRRERAYSWVDVEHGMPRRERMGKVVLACQGRPTTNSLHDEASVGPTAHRFTVRPREISSRQRSPVQSSPASSRITRAGLPAATTPAGIEVVTTLPAPITEWAPIVTP